MAYKVGVIGCGRIANVYRQVLESLTREGTVTVCAAMDKELLRAQSFASHFSGCLALDSMEDILRMDLDTVHILTPHYLHMEQTVACLESGKHVLCEKPIAIHLTDADAMIGAAESTGRQLGIIYQNRYIKGIQHAKKLLRDGVLGKITGAWSSLNWHRPPSYYECDWKGNWEKEGGGVIIDQAIHSIDLVRYLMDCEAVEVAGQIDRRVLTGIEVEDVASAAIRFENGAVYAFYACNYFTANDPILIRLSCENGSIFLTGERVEITIDGNEARTVEHSDELRLEGESYWGHHHEIQVRDFYRCLSSEQPVPFSPKDAKKTLELVQGIYYSSHTGKSCAIPSGLPERGQNWLFRPTV